MSFSNNSIVLLLKIFKNVERKIYLRLIIVFISLLINTITEVLFLNSLAVFVKSLLIKFSTDSLIVQKTQFFFNIFLFPRFLFFSK